MHVLWPSSRVAVVINQHFRMQKRRKHKTLASVWMRVRIQTYIMHVEFYVSDASLPSLNREAFSAVSDDKERTKQDAWYAVSHADGRQRQCPASVTSMTIPM
jgi:hypothetical protein